MSEFAAHTLKLSLCKKELGEFRKLLADFPVLEEREIHDFLRSRLHLCSWIATSNLNQGRIDRIAWEYPIFGDFRCDLAVGDSVGCEYTFMEFEDAAPASVFVKKKGKSTPEWSPRFEHGYSQIIDWFYKLETMRGTADMEARLGKREPSYAGVLVVGRDQYLDAGERLRLDWRHKFVIVNSRRVICRTYDQLCYELAERLETWVAAAKTGE